MPERSKPVSFYQIREKRYYRGDTIPILHHTSTVYLPGKTTGEEMKDCAGSSGVVVMKNSGLDIQCLTCFKTGMVADVSAP